MTARFPDPSVRKSIEVDVALLDQYDPLLSDLERTLVHDAKRHDPEAFYRLHSVPGIGHILALTILYEIHDITRFDRVQEFASYARLVKGQHPSAGKTLGTSGAKMGNVHLKWAFSEAAVLFLRHSPEGEESPGPPAEATREGEGAVDPCAQDRARRVLHPLARDGVFDGQIPRGQRKSAGEPEDQLEPTEGPSSSRSHCTRTVTERHEPSIVSRRSGSPAR